MSTPRDPIRLDLSIGRDPSASATVGREQRHCTCTKAGETSRGAKPFERQQPVTYTLRALGHPRTGRTKRRTPGIGPGGTLHLVAEEVICRSAALPLPAPGWGDRP